MNREELNWEELSSDPTPDTNLYCYAGRWVALVRGRIIGSGRNIREALQGIPHYTPEDQPSLVWVPASQGRLKN